MKQESISDEQRDALDKIAAVTNIPRHVIVRYAVDRFVGEFSNVNRDPMKAMFLNSVISK